MNIKELYLAAKKEFADLIDVEQQDFRLEEAEYNEKDERWDLVISYLAKNKNRSLGEELASQSGIYASVFPYERVYKKLLFNENKELIGFYIHDH